MSDLLAAPPRGLRLGWGDEGFEYSRGCVAPPPDRGVLRVRLAWEATELGGWGCACGGCHNARLFLFPNTMPAQGVTLRGAYDSSQYRSFLLRLHAACHGSVCPKLPWELCWPVTGPFVHATRMICSRRGQAALQRVLDEENAR